LPAAWEAATRSLGTGDVRAALGSVIYDVPLAPIE
jgi:hypothetical protein